MYDLFCSTHWVTVEWIKRKFRFSNDKTSHKQLNCISWFQCGFSCVRSLGGGRGSGILCTFAAVLCTCSGLLHVCHVVFVSYQYEYPMLKKDENLSVHAFKCIVHVGPHCKGNFEVLLFLCKYTNRYMPLPWYAVNFNHAIFQRIVLLGRNFNKCLGKHSHSDVRKWRMLQWSDVIVRPQYFVVWRGRRRRGVFVDDQLCQFEQCWWKRLQDRRSTEVDQMTKQRSTVLALIRYLFL